jgi:hypothetical protein
MPCLNKDMINGIARTESQSAGDLPDKKEYSL